ncbi:hypothetical protein D0810_17830 [Vibrio cholerae]|uniref:O-antigen ligase family protein n=1 Tax=Vibrio cholerae TaxID=666 RepID=UPI000B95FE28|nr:O-antigen ligase family protein [Vibrio cholerae]AWB71711.1 hypothetical protein Sa5Y_VC02589 [Vibrio cholerae]EGQ7691833.1 O-antigen ligase family protein [Vibrio cholerae]EGQ8394960.1 hypothetical protein [Vibrio cholerae]EGQ9963347.1 O-antigen ligase family protein [Vibrio cholerae]EGQ9984960.1 O-antigen ligase family protein [Vibrio cholerae]
MVLNDTKLLKILILLSSMELYYYCFPFIPRELFNAVFLIISLAFAFLLVYRSKFKKSGFFVWFVLSVWLLLSAINAYLGFGGLFWLGSWIKILFYITLSFYLYSQSKRVQVVEIYSFLKKYLVLFVIVSLILGVLLNNTQLLNGRVRFQGLTYTSSIFSMYCGLGSIFYGWVLMIERKYTTLRCIKNLIFLLIFMFACYYSGSRQAFYGVLCSLIITVVWFSRFSVKLIMFSFMLVFISIFYQEIIRSFRFMLDIMFSQNILASLSGLVDGSTLSRVRYFTYGLDYAQDNGMLLIGVGLNTFPSLYFSITATESPAAHNFILMLIINYGLLGLVVFIISFLMFLMDNRKKPIIVLLLFYFLLGTSLNNPEYFCSFIVFYIVFLYIALCMPLVNNSKGKYETFVRE